MTRRRDAIAPRPEQQDIRRDGFLNIGQVAERTGLTPKMIRHYEAIGLIGPAGRTFANYRYYSQVQVQSLDFIHRARHLGFSLSQIEGLMGLWNDAQRPSREVKRLAEAQIADLGERIRSMQAMRRSLRQLADLCHGDERPACPILDDLARADGDSRSDPERKLLPRSERVSLNHQDPARNGHSSCRE